MTELGVIAVTVLSMTAALTCRLERWATGRGVPLFFALTLFGSLLLALVAIRQRDGALAALVILDALMLRYAVTVRGQVLTVRLDRLSREHARLLRAHDRLRSIQAVPLSEGKEGPANGQR